MSMSFSPARRGRPRGSEVPELLSIAREMFIASKDALYSAVVADWVDRGYDAMRPHTAALAQAHAARQALVGLARVLQAGLLSSPVLQMRTLIAAEALRFPDVAADYITRSWTRNIRMLADALGVLDARGLLRVDDAELAAEQLTWLVVAAPLNRLTLQAGAHPYLADELESLATQGVTTFLSRYGPDEAHDRR
jgi:TetR/AcrR family transcriptional regulator, mexJK operon transcriptional repressor